MRSILTDSNRQSSLELILRIIAVDHDLSNLLFQALKELEWFLRAEYVSIFCKYYAPTADFLETENYRPQKADQVVFNIVNDALRSNEPYIIKEIQRQASVLGIRIPQRVTTEALPKCKQLVSELPIWAVVDCLSFGTLTDALLELRHPDTQHGSAPWKDIADQIQLKPRVFNSHIHSIRALRNLVAHHSRLWCRTNTYSPQMTQYLTENSENAPPKSRIIPILALTELLETSGASRRYRQEILLLAMEFPEYWYGMKSV